MIHAAARVGGIGANLRQPASFFYDNLIMGTRLLHECWKREIGKVVSIGTVCAYPKLAPIPFREDDLWNGYPQRDQRPSRSGRKDAVGAEPGANSMRNMQRGVMVVLAVASLAMTTALSASAEKLNPGSTYKFYGRTAEGGCLTGLPYTTDSGQKFCVVVTS